MGHVGENLWKIQERRGLRSGVLFRTIQTLEPQQEQTNEEDVEDNTPTMEELNESLNEIYKQLKKVGKENIKLTKELNQEKLEKENILKDLTLANQVNPKAIQEECLKLEECLKVEINEKGNLENDIRKLKHELHSLKENYKDLKIVLSREEEENAKIKKQLNDAKAIVPKSQSNLEIENQRLAKEVNDDKEKFEMKFTSGEEKL